jgi:hypothetical protein
MAALDKCRGRGMRGIIGVLVLERAETFDGIQMMHILITNVFVSA